MFLQHNTKSVEADILPNVKFHLPMQCFMFYFILL